MLEAISRILDRCETSDSVLPPVGLFNEGWMLRLVLDWFDRNRDIAHPLAFAPGARWYSEAALPSRFFPQSRSDTRAESYTHADGIIGHFFIAAGDRGYATLVPNARQFVVIEAKLGSRLSTGTKRAPTYDQATRYVACTAHTLGLAGVDPTTLDRLAFYVLAPGRQIQSGVYADLVTKQSIERKVRERVDWYEGAHDVWFETTFLPVLARIDLGFLSWEEILASLQQTPEIELMTQFYAQCLRFNPLRGKNAV
jgi:hypothetical protein